MKIIAAMVQDQDVDELLGALTERGFRATKIHTTGGFLRHSSSMLFIGVETDEMVEDALALIRAHCHPRRQLVYPHGTTLPEEAIEVEVGGAVIFVWEAERYERL
ncbi:MAG: hypothetical protein DRI26_09035 [Chloroflexi bacterium]|nr:MAG: hypothetical protein DRI26_09035 [Chloroflexota bacterium]